MSRFIIIVMDSVGVGELPDAAAFNSVGANTLGHIAEHSQLRLPHMQALGLGNILPLRGVPATAAPTAAWGKMAARSAGKDTTCGHWEIAGLVMEQPLPTYPQGFPPEVISTFTTAIGHDILGNRVASGTQIIQELGAEHVQTGRPIVYTSADSVFQLACHEDVYPPQQLYAMCEQARAIMQGPHGVGRVIARPFLGDSASGFYRTENRRDFSLTPPPHGLLQSVREASLPVVSVGKIFDIFAGQDISRVRPAHNNEQSLHALLDALREDEQGLIFANFVDFDMLYGHRNNIQGYADALMAFDAALPQIMALLRPDDILVITADHGNDPSSASTDHDREYVPLLVAGAHVQPQSLGIRAGFSDLGQTAADYLGAATLPAGQSFLAQLIKEK